MKTTFIKVLAVGCLSLFLNISLNGQTTVTGRVFAEVVESVSAASMAVTEFNISTSVTSSPQSTSEIDLGQMKIGSGESVLYNIMTTPASVSSADGKKIKIDTIVQNNISGTFSTEGNSVLNIKGIANIEQETQPAGIYQGTYNMVIAYN